MLQRPPLRAGRYAGKYPDVPPNKAEGYLLGDSMTCMGNDKCQPYADHSNPAIAACDPPVPWTSPPLAQQHPEAS